MMLLETKDLKVYYFTRRGVVKAVDGVSISLRKGEALGIVGESGCGKSTFALSLLRLIEKPGRIVGGSIILEGEDVLRLSEEEFRRRIRWKKISMVFQGAMNSLNPVYTVKDHVKETLRYHLGKVSNDEIERKTEEMLKMVGLPPDVANRYPHELSGGQKQRVVIGLALLLNPPLVIADEPTTALDVIVQAHVLKTLKRLREQYNMSIILITHDMGVANYLSDKIAVMYAGKVVEIGPVSKVIGNPLHPYTQMLIKAVPRIDSEELEWIPGSPPDLRNPPPGCRFHPRCPKKMSICMKEEPKLIEVEHEHWVACHLY